MSDEAGFLSGAFAGRARVSMEKKGRADAPSSREPERRQPASVETPALSLGRGHRVMFHWRGRSLEGDVLEATPSRVTVRSRLGTLHLERKDVITVLR